MLYLHKRGQCDLIMTCLCTVGSWCDSRVTWCVNRVNWCMFPGCVNIISIRPSVGGLSIQSFSFIIRTDATHHCKTGGMIIRCI